MGKIRLAHAIGWCKAHARQGAERNKNMTDTAKHDDYDYLAIRGITRDRSR
jgi:hypothetical protein